MNLLFRFFAVFLMAFGLMALTGCKKEKADEEQSGIVGETCKVWSGAHTYTVVQGVDTVRLRISSRIVGSRGSSVLFSLDMEGVHGGQVNRFVEYDGSYLKFGEEWVRASLVPDYRLASVVCMTPVVVSSCSDEAKELFRGIGDSFYFEYTDVSDTLMFPAPEGR